MDWLINIIREKGGSTTRLVMVYTYLLVMLVWAYACYVAGTIVDIPEHLMQLLLGLGAVKVGQKWIEKKQVSDTKESTPPTP